MLCDKIFRIVDPDNARVDVRFLAHVLGIHSVRTQIERDFSTKSGMMKNVSKPILLNLSFPLPPKNKQADMVDALTAARSAALKFRRQAKEARTDARTDFEAAVYAAEDSNVVR